MSSVKTKAGDLTLVAHRGDAKTLLAFNLPKRRAQNLAGFTIECRPHGQRPYFLHNTLRFERPERHAQDAVEPANSSLNAPFHKFRWVHIPGSLHQGIDPFYGPYTYVVTPRYLDEHNAMRPLDPALSASIEVKVGPLEVASLRPGFTRGYTQSQAFVQHFGRDARIRPHDGTLLFDTSQVAGTDAKGTSYTYAQAYEWLGFTARRMILALLDEVLGDPQLRLDVFAYDLNEPDLARRLLALAEQGRVRLILDDAALHHNATKPKPEDEFETLFKTAATGAAEIRRGRFGRYAHDKVLIVSGPHGATKVLTGSTNFSVTGLYVNSNHVLLFTDATVAGKYAEVFATVWDTDVKRAAYLRTPAAAETFAPAAVEPRVEVTFAPHQEPFAREILDGVVARIEQESRRGRTTGNVLFAVMEIDQGSSSIYDALNALHADDRIFSFGVSDGPRGISLYEPRRRTGVLVTGKPVRTRLPPPFNQVPGVGLGHQIHHKFVICGFNGPAPVVFCGSSNLAQGGEVNNGDNLLAIHDPGVVTAFTIEALTLVDHFQFLNRMSARAGTPAGRSGPGPHAAAAAGWFLSTTDRWTQPYFEPSDLHYVDRRLFA